jgi:hypothetical protein
VLAEGKKLVEFEQLKVFERNVKQIFVNEERPDAGFYKIESVQTCTV